MLRSLRISAPRMLVLGILLTLGVAALDWAGKLAPIERWFYDERSRHCQYFTPAPTDRLVHVDIDDAAIEAIGPWPWSRTTLALIIDELHYAKAEALALDIIFDRPQELGVLERPGQGLERIDHDANLAAALKRFGKTLVPVSFTFDPKPEATPRRTTLLELLRGDLELSLEEAAERLVARAAKSGGQIEPLHEDEFLGVRREAIAERLAEAQAKGARPMLELRALLLPRRQDSISAASLLRDFETQYRLGEALRETARFSIVAPGGETRPNLASATNVMTMHPGLAKAASFSGYVNYFDRPDDPIIRTVPLLVSYGGRLYPQFDLALACAMMDIDLRTIGFRPGEIVLKRPDGKEMAIPVREVSSSVNGRIGALLDIPWFGGSDWRTIYDYPDYKAMKRHVPITLPWALADTRKVIARNGVEVDKAIRILAEIGLDSAKAFLKAAPAAADIDSRARLMEPIVREATELAAPSLKTPASEWGADEKVLLNALKAVQQLLSESRVFLAKAEQLQAALKGKAILIGWSATGTGDVHPTPLHASCPGVVIHGVTFNALMTGHYWQKSPRWVVGLVTIGMGLLATVIAARFSPKRSVMATSALAACYGVVNGIVIFDRGNWILGMAGPMVAIVVVWGALTLFRLVAEARERARITRRFKSYVDPALVKYVIDHPELTKLEGDVREMTVIFTDLAGFTTFAENLREKAVAILGRYIKSMTPIIRRHNGLVHRFMGDGIMFSYGAPIPNPNQAVDGVTTVLEMFDVLETLNKELVSEGYPRLNIRAGVCTGMAVVGDSGADDAAEYACLGDTTNTAARLESANKAVGTSKMISARTVELLDGKFLVRPIGRLVLMGKSVPLMAYEPLALVGAATDIQRKLAELTTQVFDHFVAARFEECMAALNELDEAMGPSKLSGLYRELCEEYVVAPPVDFKGQIVLKEK